jgi:hypothetical protein
MRRSGVTFVAAALVVAAVVALGGFAGAEDEEGGGGGHMTPQPKIEHPFVKDAIGTWDFVATMEGNEAGKGSVTYRFAVGGTAVVEDLEGTFMGGPFAGHGVWKTDGKAFQTWWFDSFEPAAQHYVGTISDEGIEMTEQDEADPTKITVRKTATGREMHFKSGQGEMKIALTKRK